MPLTLSRRGNDFPLDCANMEMHEVKSAQTENSGFNFHRSATIVILVTLIFSNKIDLRTKQAAPIHEKKLRQTNYRTTISEKTTLLFCRWN